MISDIFSSFDPIIYSFGRRSFVFWFLIGVVLYIVRGVYWLSIGRIFWFIRYPLDLIFLESRRSTSYNIKGYFSYIIPLFIILILVNLIGLIPYCFRYSSHIVFCFILSLPLWMWIIFSSFSYSPAKFVGGILPAGVPSWLAIFLSWVEGVRIRVRPATLAVRLVANTRAGHIVLSIIGIYASCLIFSFNMIFLSLLLIILESGYILFEVGISFAQAFIFPLLGTMYTNEHR